MPIILPAEAYRANLDIDEATLALNSLMQGFSVGILWVPLTVATSYAALYNYSLWRIRKA